MLVHKLILSAADGIAVFISPDGVTIDFSSNGIQVSGIWIFLVLVYLRKIVNKWAKKPTNLGLSNKFQWMMNVLFL